MLRQGAAAGVVHLSTPVPSKARVDDSCQLIANAIPATIFYRYIVSLAHLLATDPEAMAQQQKPAYQRGSDWNFLSGGGPENPSSAAHYYKEVEKDGRFKPGWQSLRPAKAIQADAERKQQEAVKVRFML